MTLFDPALTPKIIGLKAVDDPTELETFLQPDCAAALWHRHMPAPVQAWIDGLDPECLPMAREIMAPGQVSEFLNDQFVNAGTLPSVERDWLHDDIVSLSHSFAKLLSAKFLRVRLSVVTTNSCRKFHLDAIKARLICTYRGTGTQLGIGQMGADIGAEKIITVPTGTPILLRGSLWPPQPATSLLHRSPPIEGSGQTRFVVVLDPIENPSTAP